MSSILFFRKYYFKNLNVNFLLPSPLLADRLRLFSTFLIDTCKNTSLLETMANFNTKRPMEEDNSDSSEEDEEENDSQDEEMVEDEQLGENDREIQVDFEGQSPCAEDFHGIKSLMHQLFLKAHINLSGLTELIIQQNYIGSILQVIKSLQDII